MNQDFINRKRQKFQKIRTDALSKMFDTVRADGIYATTELFNTLDDAFTQSLTEAMEEGRKRSAKSKALTIKQEYLDKKWDEGYKRGYAAALDDVEREMPEQGPHNECYLDQCEACDAPKGFNAYRTAVLTMLSRLRGEKK